MEVIQTPQLDESYLKTPLGIDSNTRKLTNIETACRPNKYICPECNKSLIIKDGEIKVKHFSHKAKGDCHYANGGEGIIHKNCKLILCELLNNGGVITIYLTKCSKCLDCPDKLKTIEIKGTAVEEYHLVCDGNRYADVAVLDGDGDPIYYLEVWNSHLTDLVNHRPLNTTIEIKVTDIATAYLDKNFNFNDRDHVNHNFTFPGQRQPCQAFRDKQLQDELEHKQFAEEALRLVEEKRQEALRLAERKKEKRQEASRLTEEKKMEYVEWQRLEQLKTPNMKWLIKERDMLEDAEKRLINEDKSDIDRKYRISRYITGACVRYRRRALEIRNHNKTIDNLDQDELEFREKRITMGTDEAKFYQTCISEGYEANKTDWTETIVHVDKLVKLIVKATSEREVGALVWSIKNVYQNLEIKLD